MTRVDFYVIDAASGTGPDLLACRLAAKAFAQGRRVYLLAGTDAHAELLDELLWTFRDVSFVPHKCAGDHRLPGTAVLIGAGEPPREHSDVMINLRHPVPEVFSRFERVIEIVPAETEGRHRARERYRFYQERGYSLATHGVR